MAETYTGTVTTDVSEASNKPQIYHEGHPAMDKPGYSSNSDRKTGNTSKIAFLSNGTSSKPSMDRRTNIPGADASVLSATETPDMPYSSAEKRPVLDKSIEATKAPKSAHNATRTGHGGTSRSSTVGGADRSSKPLGTHIPVKAEPLVNPVSSGRSQTREKASQSISESYVDQQDYGQIAKETYPQGNPYYTPPGGASPAGSTTPTTDTHHTASKAKQSNTSTSKGDHQHNSDKKEKAPGNSTSRRAFKGAGGNMPVRRQPNKEIKRPTSRAAQAKNKAVNS